MTLKVFKHQLTILVCGHVESLAYFPVPFARETNDSEGIIGELCEVEYLEKCRVWWQGFDGFVYDINSSFPPSWTNFFFTHELMVKHSVTEKNPMNKSLWNVLPCY